MRLNENSSTEQLADDNSSVKTKISPSKGDEDRKSILSRNSRAQSKDNNMQQQ